MSKRKTNEEYSVERIVEHRDGDVETEYLIEWTGYIDFTWIERSEFVQATDVLANYWDNFLKNSGDPVMDTAKYFLDLAPLYKKKALYVAKGLEVSDGIEKAYRRLRRSPSQVPTAVQAFVHSLFRNVDDIQTKLAAFKRQMKLKRLKLMDDENLPMNSIDEERASVEETDALADELVNEPLMTMEERAVINDWIEATETAAEHLTLNERTALVNDSEEDRADRDEGNLNDSTELIIVLDDEKDDKKKKLNSKRLACEFPKCGKAFKTKKGLRDHKRYHQKIPCGWKTCDWTGAMKKFYEHVRRVHPEMKILVARMV